jgi:hypothetical protein
MQLKVTVQAKHATYAASQSNLGIGGNTMFLRSSFLPELMIRRVCFMLTHNTCKKVEAPVRQGMLHWKRSANRTDAFVPPVQVPDFAY